MDIKAKYIETQEALFEKFGVDPESILVDTDGPVKKIRYLKLGSGDPLVMVHGGFSHASEWLPIMKSLSEKFTLYVPDRPGHGLSDPIDYTGQDYPKSAAEFLRSFLDAVGLEKPRFLGSSMGAFFSINFAFVYPERVEQLILIGAPAGMNYELPEPIKAMAAPPEGEAAPEPSMEWQKHIHGVMIVYNADKIPDLYYEHCSYGMLLPGAATAHRTLAQAVMGADGWRKECYIGDQLHRLKMPVAFIWGDKDVFETAESAREKANAIENHRFEVVENAAHCPWFDEPERCVELILEMTGK